MQARVSGLNGCGKSVVLVELDVLVLVVVVAVCACPVSPSNTVLASIANVRVLDTRNIAKSPSTGRRAPPVGRGCCEVDAVAPKLRS
jgi:hypothetical protein